MRARLTLDVADEPALKWPMARVDGPWLTFGFHRSLGIAARIAVDGMVKLMRRGFRLKRADALVLASVGVDLHVTQIVSVMQGVHAVLRDEAFRV